ncbi:hypothetical protein C4553_02420 [Candidatus Parcubacteria bacterium]|nr:MAG: hypothetical protein C4553_02420 [Candidatus Parcubacteria bacterium]
MYVCDYFKEGVMGITADIGAYMLMAMLAIAFFFIWFGELLISSIVLWMERRKKPKPTTTS